MSTKYVARLNNEIVGTRVTKDRTYTHAIVVYGHSKGPEVRTWCGRLDLARKELSLAIRTGFSAEIVPAEIFVKPAKI